jgi:hypothetical protein
LNQEEIELEIFKNIGKVISHKTLAEEVGYSVGKVNYVLRGLILIEKGLIKVERFIDRKKAEYDKLQVEMELYKKQYDYAKESVVK